jgi:hypothetical protein
MNIKKDTDVTRTLHGYKNGQTDMGMDMNTVMNMNTVLNMDIF